MDESTDRSLFRRRIFAPSGAEKDLTFRTAIHRLVKSSMFAVGMLGITIPIIYTLIHLFLVGKHLSWQYDQFGSPATLVIWDKLLIAALGAISLVLSRTKSGPRWGRLIVALMIIVASVAMMIDDIAGSDLSLTAGWLALLMFISTTVPFRPWHTLTLCVTILGAYLLSVSYVPILTGWESIATRPEYLIFLALVALACTGISGLLYTSLFNQHQTRRMLAATNRKLRDTQAQLVQSAKLASLGNLVAGIAHEINTPLGAIHSNASLATRALDRARSALDDRHDSVEQGSPGNLRRSLQVLADMNAVTLKASDRIDNIIRALRNFARLDEAERKHVDLHEGIESALAILPQPPDKNIRIVRDFGELPHISCFPSQFNQVLMNLLLNSIEAIDSEGTITISTRQEGNWVVVQVGDTGRGISKEERHRVFDPGYTTKGVGVGTGLGLSISYRIIESHNGQIDISSEPGKGTVVTLRLPIH